MVKERESVAEQAVRLARMNQRDVPSIVRTYVFPSEEEIRIVNIDRDAWPEDGIYPLEFAPLPQDGIHVRSFQGLIPPQMERRAEPPQGWGAWDAARLVERPARRRKVPIAP